MFDDSTYIQLDFLKDQIVNPCLTEIYLKQCTLLEKASDLQNTIYSNYKLFSKIVQVL